MIKYFPLSAMQEIEKHATLHLTGSRFFSKYLLPVNTDWDFIVEPNNKESGIRIFKILEEANAQEVSSEYITQVTTLNKVYRLQENNNVYDLQFVENITIKLIAQARIKLILDMGFELPASKYARSLVWAHFMKQYEVVG